MLTGCDIDGFCALLHEVSSGCARKQAEALAAAGLTVAEFHMLAELTSDPQPRLEELAMRLRVSRSRLTRVIAGLERKGLARRKRHTSDKREVLVTVSPAGRQRLEQGAASRATAASALLACMNPSQREQLHASLVLLSQQLARE